jgi:hypothetical protein
MVEILALAPEDGWAYVREGERIRLIRPPYTRSRSFVVSEQSVAIAIAKHGFMPADDLERCYPDWPALIQFLGGRMLEALQAKRLEIAEDTGERMLEFATIETLNRYLARIDAELIPNSRWDHAESLLLNMLCLQVLREASESCNRAVALLKKVQEGRRQEENAKLRLAVEDGDFERVFPQASARYGRDRIARFAERISSRGNVFAFS